MSEWIDIDKAPIGIWGFVWSPEFPTFTNVRGFVYLIEGGEKRIHSTESGNFAYSHWHAFLSPPTQPQTGE